MKSNCMDIFLKLTWCKIFTCQLKFIAIERRPYLAAYMALNIELAEKLSSGILPPLAKPIACESHAAR